MGGQRLLTVIRNRPRRQWLLLKLLHFTFRSDLKRRRATSPCSGGRGLSEWLLALLRGILVLGIWLRLDIRVRGWLAEWTVPGRRPHGAHGGRSIARGRFPAIGHGAICNWFLWQKNAIFGLTP